MLRIFQEEMLVSALMLFFFILGISMKILLGVLYIGMIRETDNMSSTKNRLLKQCKLKFANCYQLNNGVSNIPVFVDKFINRLKLGFLTFEGIDHLSGQAMLLSVVCAGVGICRCIMKGKTLGEILPFYIASFIGLYVYFSVSTVVDVKGKRKSLKINLVDYLENHLSTRLEVTADDIAMLYGDSRASYTGRAGRRMQEADFREGREPKEEGYAPSKMAVDSAQDAAEGQKKETIDEEELESLLREFLAI